VDVVQRDWEAAEQRMATAPGTAVAAESEDTVGYAATETEGPRATA
jgi:hypothetical protein